MGIPQLTRRYPWAWFTALKDANANAVRLHAQVYPRFYLDVADEMGICVLAETANWASDGGPKLDSPLFWENSKDHLKRMVLRDRNHAGVFGWSISNENKPVILSVFNKPEWMEWQKQAWVDWRDIVRENDPTRPWISSDGEEDGEGILPVTVGHYGDENSLKHWADIGKPWGVGETGMAYYGTPEQVSKFNGERAYESMEGRMEGLAYECYKLISQQRNSGAAYVSVFNIAWYGLQPLPFGKRDLTTPSVLDDGIYFEEYKEGQPGVQPERMGPYCSTFNPGYDPTLPLYRTWPMFDAIRAANAGDKPAWSKWSEQPENVKTKETIETTNTYNTIFFVGEKNSAVQKIFEKQGVEFASDKINTSLKQATNALVIVDGSYNLGDTDITKIKKHIAQGSDIWIWSPTPSILAACQSFLPDELTLQARSASSFIPVNKSWMRNTANSDFYFCEIQTNEVSQYGIAGKFANEGETLLNACNTNWRKWNKQPEELKTAAVLRSENEEKGSAAVFVKYPTHGSTFYVSTLTDFTATEKGYHTLAKILKSAGIPTNDRQLTASLMDDQGFIQLSNLLVSRVEGRKNYSLWVYSPRPLDNLLIEPDMPKLNLSVAGQVEIRLNGKKLESHIELPLKQGWNQLIISLPGNTDASTIQLVCSNHPEFLKQLQTSLSR
jgi:beta-galactosidase